MRKFLVAMGMFWALLAGAAHAENADIWFTADIHLGADVPFAQEVTEALLAQAKETDAILILGDLTGNGKPSEHENVKATLERAKQQGTNIYVLPGNHDMTVYSAEEFADTYAAFGYGQAYARDDTTLSYAVHLTENTDVIMLDTCVYTQTGGQFSDATAIWLEGVLQEAQMAGKYVIAAGHHPVLAHSIREEKRSDLTQGREKLTALLEKYHVSVYLTGHRHNLHYAVSGGLAEIVACQPTRYPNRVGMLEIRESGDAEYRAEKFEIPMPLYAQYAIDEAENEGYDMARGALKNTENAGDEEMTAFFQKIYLAYRDGNLWKIRGECLADPAYLKWEKNSSESILREWVGYLLDNMVDDYTALHIASWQ